VKKYDWRVKNIQIMQFFKKPIKKGLHADRNGVECTSIGGDEE